MKNLVVSAVVLATSLSMAEARGQNDTATISLEQAIERAVAGNADLRRERATVGQALGRRLTAEGKFDVLLDAHLDLDHDVVPLCGSVACSDLGVGTNTSANLGLGLSRKLETGGAVRLDLGTSRLWTRVPQGLDLYQGSYYVTSLALSFTQPLLRGLGAEVAEAQLRKARLQADVEQLGRQMRACNVVRDVVLAYWELAYGTRDLAIKRSAVELAQEQLRITQAMIAAGRLADADAASVERAIAQRQEEQATAEKNLTFRNLDLWRLFGVVPASTSPGLAANDVPSAAPPEIDEAAEVTRALDVNPQLRALRLGRALSELDLVTARDTLRPKLDLTGGVGSVARTPRFGGALSDAAGFGDMTWSAGLRFELPVQNRAAQGREREAHEGHELARIDAEDFALQVRDLVLRASRSVRTAARRVELGEREVEFAEKNLDAERARFEAGRATNNDVVLRQQELKDAETRLLRARIDQAEAEAALAAVTGEILDRYGVTLKGI
jgi:outer membrane protein TolC